MYTSYLFFVLFFGITWLVYQLLPLEAKWCALLAGSAFFYFVSTKGHLEFILITTLTVWAAGLALQRLNDGFQQRKKQLDRSEAKKLKIKYKHYKSAVLSGAVILNFAVLWCLKYFNFFADSLNSLFSAAGINLAIAEFQLILPLGISFYTLQAVSYIVDIHRGKYPACRNPFRIALYLMFMLTIVEGPIARYDQLGTQLNTGRRFHIQNVSLGIQLIIWGLFKKVVIADRLSSFVGAVFDQPDSFFGLIVLAAILAYTLQLYAEFSGVMDIVTGCAQTMGIDMPKNFSRPFFAKSINEFWQRWHITLGAWLRDYVFYSVSLSKPFMSLTKSARKKFNPFLASLIPSACALFFVWFGNGIWHGASWKYICYGLYYYVLMTLGMFLEPAFAKICSALKINRKSKGFSLFQIARTFVIVNFGMLIFRADTLSAAFSMLKSVFGSNDWSVLNKTTLTVDRLDLLVVLIGLILITGVSLYQESGRSVRSLIGRQKPVIRYSAYLASLLLIIIFGAYGGNYGVVDLIYAQF